MATTVFSFSTVGHGKEQLVALLAFMSRLGRNLHKSRNELHNLISHVKFPVINLKISLLKADEHVMSYTTSHNDRAQANQSIKINISERIPLTLYMHVHACHA